jgi:hypothetical protein
MNRSDRAPKARRTRLVVKELANETLIYDEDNHQAHCLNQMAAFVWKHCDGRKSVPALTRLMEREMDTPGSEHTIRFALRQLEEARLLEPSPLSSQWSPQRSRRELIRTLGVAAVALPVIASVVVPTAAMAATCRTIGQSCTGAPNQGNCCTNLICDAATNNTCIP